MTDPKTNIEALSSLSSAQEELQNAAEFTKEKGEALLATLKNKTEKATTDAERARIDGVIMKIRQLSEGTQIHTENMIDSLKNSLTPEQKRIVADADSAIGEKIGARAENLAASAKRVAGDLMDQAPKGLGDMKQGIEKTAGAVASGDLSGAKKMAEWIMEKVGADGKKILEYSGGAAFSKVFEPISKDGFSFDNLFKCIGNLFKFLFGFGKFSEILGETGEKLDDVKSQADAALKVAKEGKEDIAGAFDNAQAAYEEFKKLPNSRSSKEYNEAVKKVWASFEKLDSFKEKLSPDQKKWFAEIEKKLPFNLLRTLTNPEKKDEWIETQIGPVCKRISDEFYAGGDLSAAQIEKVREGLKTMHFGQDTVIKIKSRIEDPNNPLAASVADPANLLVELLLGNKEMLGIMFDVVPWHRFVWGVAKKTVSEGASAYEYNLSLVFNKIQGVEPVEMTFTSDTLGKQFASMKDNPIAQDMMLMQMYRVNGLFANILGTAVGGAYSALYMAVDNSHGVDGIDSFKKAMSKDYAGLTKEMDQLEKAFAGNSKFKPEFAQAVRAELSMVKQNWLLIALAEEGKGNVETIKKLLSTEAYGSLPIRESDIVKNANNIRGYLAGLISTESVNSSALSRLPGRFAGTASGAGADFIDHLQDAKKFQKSILQGDIMSKLKELTGSLKILTLPRHADKTLLYFRDIDSATNTMRQLGATGGGFLKELFRSLPAVGLMIGGVDIATKDSRELSSPKWLTFIKAAGETMVPIVGPIMLLTDSETAPRINKDGQIENIGTGIAAAGLLTLDGLMLAKAVSPMGKWITNYFLERPRDVLRVGQGIVRTTSTIAHATPRLLSPKWAPMAEKVLIKGGKWGKILALGVALGVGGYAYAHEANRDHEKELVEKGLLDPKTGEITDKTKKLFSEMPADDKKSFVDTLSHAVFDTEKDLAHAKSHLDENGVYSLVVDTAAEAAKWGTSLNAKHNHFEWELAKLGIGVEIEDKQTHAEMVEKAKKEKEKSIA